MLRIASVALVLQLCAALVGQAQTISTWTNPSNGQYVDSGNWDNGDVPGDDCCVNETARFDLSASRNVELPTSAPLTPFAMEFRNGQTTFRAPLGIATATIDVVDQILVESAGGVVFSDKTVLNAPSMVIGGGQANQTGLTFAAGSSASIGDLTVGVVTESGPDSVFSVFDATVGVGDVSVGADGVAGHTSVFEVFGGEVTQADESTFSIGDGLDNGGAFVSVNDGGVLRTASGGLTVNPSGRLVNNGGEIHFGGDVVLEAEASYTEFSDAVRSFAEESSITVADGAEIVLHSEPLVLDAGQTLTIEGPQGVVDALGSVEFGAAARLELSVASDGLTAITSDAAVTLGGELVVSLAEIPLPGETIELIEGIAISGEFDDVQLPSIAGIKWDLQQSASRLSLAVLPGIPGDYNGDDLVDAQDYTVWRDTLGSTADLRADGDRDGQIDADDYLEWREAFTGAATPTSATPAPPSAILVLSSLLACGFRRREPA